MSWWLVVPGLIAIAAGLFMLVVSAIGLLRLPDAYTRDASVTKAGTLGIGLIALGCALLWQDLAISGRLVALMIFLLLSGPIAGHMIGRGAWRRGLPITAESIPQDDTSDGDA